MESNIEQQNLYNAKQMEYYYKRKLEGRNKQLIPIEQRKTCGRKPKEPSDKLTAYIISHTSNRRVGRPRKVVEVL